MSTSAQVLAVLGPLVNPTFGTVLAFALLLVLIALLMRPRRFYLVRHGETLANEQHLKQGAEGALSDKGKRQAELVGQALKGLHIHTVISSPFERAMQTAAIIASIVGARISYTPLLAERKNPSEVIGRSTKDPEVERIMNLVEDSYHEDGYRYSDEENFIDQHKRAKQCLRYLVRHGGRHTCVVTHHAILKMLIATMLYDDRLHAGDFTKLFFFNFSTNAGITVCEYNPWERFSKTRGWNVLEWDARVEGV